MRKVHRHRLLLGALILGLSGLVYYFNKSTSDPLERLLLLSSDPHYKNRLKQKRLVTRNQTQETVERLPASTRSRKIENNRYGSLVESGALAIPKNLAEMYGFTILGEENGYAFVAANALSTNLRRMHSTAVVMYSTSHYKPLLISSYIRIVLKDAKYAGMLQNFLQTDQVQPLHRALNSYALSFADIPSDRDLNELMESLRSLNYVQMVDIPEVLPRVDSP